MTTNSDKIKIYCEEDCGNAPKKELLKEFIIALAKNDLAFCSSWVHDEISWEIIGGKLIEGKESYENALNDIGAQTFQELRIHNIITHGNTASLNGTLVAKNGKRFEFCDVYNFAGFGKKAKIKKITSYVIVLNDERGI